MTLSEILSSINLIILLGLIIYLIFRNKTKTDSQDLETISKNVILGIQSQQSSAIGQVFELMSSQTQKQNDLVQQQLVTLERRFAELQIGIQDKLIEGLGKSQESIQNRLENALKSMTDFNRIELGKLQDTTKSGLETLTKTNQERLDRINTDVQKKLDDSFEKHTKSFLEVEKNLMGLRETAVRMIDSTKSIDKLNSIFSRTSSKAFGDFGEKYLKSLLSENLNQKSWGEQVTIPGSSDKIDFVLYLDDKKLGIDSKFPVTKYQDYINAENDQKKFAQKQYLKWIIETATDISKKYLKNGFIDHLMMYLPSDSMYAEVANDEDTMTILQKLKVTPISPVTIFPLIMTIRTYQFKQHVNENAEKIIAGLGVIKKNVESFQFEFRKLGDKIRQAQQNYDTADKSLTTVTHEVLQLESSEQTLL